MSRAELRALLLEALRLKELPRAGWQRVGVRDPESVADHSWGVAWLVTLLCPPELDRGKALAIAVLHDLAELRVGDLTPHDGVASEDKARLEDAAFRALLAGLPNGAELLERVADYGSSPEGRFVKACDKLDMALQAARYAEQGVDTREFIDSALERLEGELAALARG